MSGHLPVMLKEVVAAIAPKDGGHYVDGTFGGGGYARAILEAADCRVLGIDRERPVGATKHDALHPGLLRIISQVVENAHAAGRRVCVCGEMASDPEGALALAVLQVDALSVAVQQLPAIRQLLSGQNGRELTALKPDLFRQRTAVQAREFLQTHAAVPQLETAGVA